MLVGRSCAAKFAISVPSMLIAPEVGVSKPASMRKRVVFPQPEPPSRQNSSPAKISSDTSSTAFTAPNDFVTFWILMKGSAFGANQGRAVGVVCVINRKLGPIGIAHKLPCELRFTKKTAHPGIKVRGLCNLRTAGQGGNAPSSSLGVIKVR